MRTLDQTELDTVAGGTFGLISCLLGSLTKKLSYDCNPAPKCAPEPPKCAPAPKPHKGC